MLSALLFGLVASALAFASGALITALAFDLFEESFRRGGAWLSAIGLLAGAANFVVADELLDRHVQGAGSGVSAVPHRRSVEHAGYASLSARRHRRLVGALPTVACQHTCFAGSSAFCRSGLARPRTSNPAGEGCFRRSWRRTGTTS